MSERESGLVRVSFRVYKRQDKGELICEKIYNLKEAPSPAGTPEDTSLLACLSVGVSAVVVDRWSFSVSVVGGKATTLVNVFVALRTL